MNTSQMESHILSQKQKEKKWSNLQIDLYVLPLMASI